MSRLIKNSLGITLIELLAAIVITLIIAGLTFPILLNGMKTANDIQKETMLRDEADYLMASIIKDLYVTKETEIQSRNFPDADTSNYYITKINGNKTGFINDKLHVSNKIINTNNSDIVLLPSKIIDLDNGQYEIVLNLKFEGRKSKGMKFVNIIRTINDIEKEEEAGA